MSQLKHHRNSWIIKPGIEQPQVPDRKHDEQGLFRMQRDVETMKGIFFCKAQIAPKTDTKARMGISWTGHYSKQDKPHVTVGLKCMGIP